MGIIDDLRYNTSNFFDNSKDFLASHNLVAQIVFFILIILIFIALLRVGTYIISAILTPNPNPYLISGMIDAKNQMIFTQDPKINGSIPILRSRNQYNGIEFTWVVWINITDPTYKEYKYKHVFHKGNPQLDNAGIAVPNNGPGLYISPVDYPNMAEISLLVRMNIYTNMDSQTDLVKINETCQNAVRAQQTVPNIPSSQPDFNTEYCQKIYETLNNSIQTGADSDLSEMAQTTPFAPAIYDDIEIAGIPINKWVCVIIRCSNNDILDVYINGKLTKRHKLAGVARQNYGDVYALLGGGFDGRISNLHYYDYAIGTTEIDNIVTNGPNLKPMKGSTLEESKPRYLADRWFFDETNNLYQPN